VVVAGLATMLRDSGESYEMYPLSDHYALGSEFNDD
jgi:hypothetical protein